MAARNKKNLINLLPQEDFASTTFGRIIIWLLSTFRIIVIITELIVVLAFISRFWFDAKSNDLDDEIKQKQSIISSYSAFEKEFRESQKRINVIKFALDTKRDIANYLVLTSGYMPSQILLTTFSLNDDGLSLRGQSTSEEAIAQFIVNLENDKAFEKVRLYQADASSNSPFISFEIKTEIEKN